MRVGGSPRRPFSPGPRGRDAVLVFVARGAATTGVAGGGSGHRQSGLCPVLPRPDPLGHCSPGGGGREGDGEEVRICRAVRSCIASERRCSGKSSRPRTSVSHPRTTDRRAGGAEALGPSQTYPLKAATTSVVAGCPRGPGGSRKRLGNHRVPSSTDWLASCRTSGCVRRTQRSPPIRKVGLVIRQESVSCRYSPLHPLTGYQP